MTRITRKFIRGLARARGSVSRDRLRVRCEVGVGVALAIAVPVVALTLGCGGAGSREAAVPRDAQKISTMGETSLADTTSEFPRLRYADGQLSLNDRCIVRQVKLNPRLPAIYVNGRPIGFC